MPCVHAYTAMRIHTALHALHTHTHTHKNTHKARTRVRTIHTRIPSGAHTHEHTHACTLPHTRSGTGHLRACKGACMQGYTHTHPRSHTHTHTVTCRHIRPYIRHAFPPCNYIHTQTCLHDTHACLEGRRARVCARQGCTLACKQGIKKISNAMMVEDFIS